MKENSIVLDTVEMISQLMGELESKAFEQEGFSEITMPQMLYLETISRLEQPTFGDIAEHLGVTRPSVSAIVKKLIKMEYPLRMAELIIFSLLEKDNALMNCIRKFTKFWLTGLQKI